MPIMQDFRGFDKTNIAKDVSACRKAVDVLWTAAEQEAQPLIPGDFAGRQDGRSGPRFIRGVNRSKWSAKIFETVSAWHVSVGYSRHVSDQRD
jgi:hypothetical protein